MKIINESLVDRVLELYKERGNVKQIAEITGLNMTTVYKYLKLRGVDTKAEHTEKKNRIEDLLEEGYSQAEIARILNIPSATVNVIVYRIRKAENEPLEQISEVEIHSVEDPVFYIPHKATNEIYQYQGKRYRDVSALWLGG